MKLLVIILSLLSERYLVHALSQLRFNWFSTYFKTISQGLPQSSHGWNQAVILLAIVLPLVILCVLITSVFDHILFGFIGFLLHLIIFYYCLGPQNPFYPIRENPEVELNEVAVGEYLAKVNGQLFAVVFWYIAFGVLGVVSYRLASLCRNFSLTNQLATNLTNWLDWIPARITVLLYLLVGNFQQGIHFFTQKLFSSPAHNDTFLSEGGLLAARLSETESVQMPYAESLVEHAMVVYLVCLALFTLGALL